MVGREVGVIGAAHRQCGKPGKRPQPLGSLRVQGFWSPGADDEMRSHWSKAHVGRPKCGQKPPPQRLASVQPLCPRAQERAGEEGRAQRSRALCQPGLPDLPSTVLTGSHQEVGKLDSAAILGVHGALKGWRTLRYRLLSCGWLRPGGSTSASSQGRVVDLVEHCPLHSHAPARVAFYQASRDSGSP